MSYNQWLTSVCAQYSIEQYLFGKRKGHYLMDELYKVRPDLYNQVVIKGIDAFYGDCNIPKVLDYVSMVWEEK